MMTQERFDKIEMECGCGYWRVCSDKGCPCAITTENKGFSEETYSSFEEDFRKEQEEMDREMDYVEDYFDEDKEDEDAYEYDEEYSDDEEECEEENYQVGDEYETIEEFNQRETARTCISCGSSMCWHEKGKLCAECIQE